MPRTIANPSGIHPPPGYSHTVVATGRKRNLIYCLQTKNYSVVSQSGELTLLGASRGVSLCSSSIVHQMRRNAVARIAHRQGRDVSFDVSS